MQGKWACAAEARSYGVMGFHSGLLEHSLSGCSLSGPSCHVLRSPSHLERPPVNIWTTNSCPSQQATSLHPLPAMWLLHSRCISIKFGGVCYVAMGNWIHLTCRSSDYHVRLTVKMMQNHLVNHKVFHERKGSLLILWVPALPFLSWPKERLLACVLAHGNFVT